MVMMTKQNSDLFSDRLSKEVSVISRDERDSLIFAIGRKEIHMRADHQDVPVWRGPISEEEILGREVMISTEQGDRTGRVVFFGIQCKGSQYERSVIVFNQASGTHHEAPGSDIRLPNELETGRLGRETAMAEKLREVSNAIELNSTKPQKKKRIPNDPAFIQKLIAIANETQLHITENKGFHKIYKSTLDGSKKIYVAKSGMRVDLSGFTFEHPAVKCFTIDEAREAGIGAVRGQLLFDNYEQTLDAFSIALSNL